jgi:hypothetical protein
MGVSGQCHAPEKEPPVPIVQEAGRAPEPVWTPRLEEKSFRHCRGLNLDRPVFQPVVRHYTDWATPAHTHSNIIPKSTPNIQAFPTFINSFERAVQQNRLAHWMLLAADGR